MVNTIKFSEFADVNLNTSTNLIVGVSSSGGGSNFKSTYVISWTTGTRPSSPYGGLLGYNSSIQQYEYWDDVGTQWIQLSAGDSGTVTQVNTGTGLTGGPITNTGTISFAPIAAHSLWANVTGASAVPTVIPTSTFLLTANNLSDVPNKATARTNLGLAIGTNVEAWSPILDEVAAGIWAGATSITTLGTIAFGTWQGATVQVPYGGTGNTTFTAYSVLCAGTTATGAFQNVSGVGSSGQILTSNGAGLLPTWQNNAASGTVNSGLQNELAWYAANGTTISGLTTANNGTLITSAGGVPSISSTLPTAVQGNITQLGAQSQALNMNSHLINNVTDPVSAQDAATKFYVDQTALNGTSVYAASAASLGTVTQSGSGVGATLTNAGVQATFALDGVNPPVDSNVLIKNTATGMTAANEGIYTVTDAGSGATNWVLTRATSYDTPTEINNTGLIAIQNGSTLAGQAWYNSTTIVTVDTTAFNYNRFGSSGTVTSISAGTGITCTPDPITSSGTVALTTPVSLTNGGTNASLVASNGGIFYSTASAGAILSGTSTANQVLLSGSSAAPSWSTATYPATTTINQLLYSSAANTIAGLTTANNGLLVTSNSGVPSILAGPGATGKILQSNASAAPSFSTATYPSVATSTGTILRANGTNWVASTATFADTYTASNLLYSNGSNTVTGLATANNGVLVTNGSGVPSISSTLPAFTTSSITFSPTTGGIVGTTTNDNAAAGKVGEIISSEVLHASQFSVTSGSATNVTSITLTAGDWDVHGSVAAEGTTLTLIQGGTSTTSATLPDQAYSARFTPYASTAVGGCAVPYQRYSVSGSTTVYLVIAATGTTSGSTLKVCGAITARRAR